MPEAESQLRASGAVKQMTQFWLILAQSTTASGCGLVVVAAQKPPNLNSISELWNAEGAENLLKISCWRSMKISKLFASSGDFQGIINSFGELCCIDSKHLCFWKSGFYQFFITYTGSSAGLNAIYPAGHIDFDLGDQSILVRDCVTSSYKNCQG